MGNWRVGDRVSYTARNGVLGTVREVDESDSEQPVRVEWDRTLDGEYVYYAEWPQASDVEKVGANENESYLFSRAEISALVGTVSDEALRKLLLVRSN